MPFHDKKSKEKYEELLPNRYMSFAGQEVRMESNATLILTTVMLCKGFCSFMHCANEMIEDLCSVALFFKKAKKKKTKKKKLC